MESPLDAREARSPWPAQWTPTGRQQPRVDHDDHDYTQNDHAISGGDGAPQNGGGKPMICAKYVFRCFKWLERAGDALTGAAGPLFDSSQIRISGDLVFYGQNEDGQRSIEL
ncbi:hypothetical protein EIP86_005902 [Pleurotus ostreatoroseus]|nr:hypothetical protein EIP86_005902 [Pleurotus ostreatoroseus]